MAWIPRIAAFLLGRRRVAILHHDGEVEFKWAKNTPFGLMVSTYTKGWQSLEADGSVSGGAKWMVKWAPA